MPAIRVIDQVAELSDWNQPSFADGQVAGWDQASGKFIGKSNLSDAHYVHVQNALSTSWVVVHNLSKFPAVEVVDSGGTRVLGDIVFNSVNQLTLSFSFPFTGKAYLN